MRLVPSLLLCAAGAALVFSAGTALAAAQGQGNGVFNQGRGNGVNPNCPQAVDTNWDCPGVPAARGLNQNRPGVDTPGQGQGRGHGRGQGQGMGMGRAN